MLVSQLAVFEFVPTVKAQGWLSGWIYRKSHVINSASGAGTNYQVRIKVYYGSGTDSGENVYLNGKCKTDFGDIRFTRSDGETLLDYWMEEKVDSNYAVFWVEIADDLSSNPATIYIYYGKSDATTTSNGANTFDDFDDFLTNTLANYVQINSGWSINTNAPGYLVSPSSGEGYIAKSKSLSRAYAVRARVYMSSSHAGVGFIWGTAGGGENSVNGYIQNYYPTITYSQLRRWVAPGSWLNLANLPALSSGWYIMELRITSSTLICVRDTTQDASATDTRFTTLNGVGFRQAAPSTNAIDWWALRKYVSPEPSHGSWGSEETIWLSGWSYRKSHVINSASGAGTNYQVKIVAHYGSGTDSGADVYLNSHCRSDFGDVRFTRSDAVTLLDYWMEEKVDSDYAIFWVEVADDLSSNPVTIYIYYGKSDATTTSDASSTFICGTDFDKDDGFLIRDNGVDESFGDQTGEVRTGGANQELYFSGDRTHQNWVKKQLASTLTQNFAVRIKFKFDTGTGAFGVDHPLCSIESGDYPQNHPNNYLLSITWLYSENKLIIREFRGTTYTGSSGILLNLNTWYVAEMRVPGTTATLVVGSSSDTKTVTLDDRNWFKPLNYITGWSSQTNTHHLAFAVLRKYVDPEPSHGSWGSEETSGGVTYERSAGQTLTLQAVSSRQTSNQRSAVQSLQFLLQSSRQLTVVRTPIQQILFLQAVVRQFTGFRTADQNFLILTETARSASYQRASSTALSIMADALRTLSTPRTANQIVTVLTEASRYSAYSRTTIQPLSVLLSTIRQVTFARQINQPLNFLTTSSLTKIFGRYANQLLTILTQTIRQQSLNRIVQQPLNILLSATRQASYSRTAEVLLQINTQTAIKFIVYVYVPTPTPAPAPVLPTLQLDLITQTTHITHLWWQPTTTIEVLVINKGTVATDVTFEYTLLDSRNQIVTQGTLTVFISGLDKKTVSINIPTPPDGNYTIQFKAIEPVKVEAKSVTVTVETPFYGKLSFTILIIVLFALAIYLVGKKRR
jgi:hypothetical protein